MAKPRYGWMADAELLRQSQDPNTPADDRRAIIDELSTRGARSAARSALPGSPTAPTKVLITGVTIPFSDMVALLVKLSLASIPAMIIVCAILALIYFAILVLVGHVAH